jgi:hypothetical protein
LVYEGFDFLHDLKPIFARHLVIKKHEADWFDILIA